MQVTHFESLKESVKSPPKWADYCGDYAIFKVISSVHYFYYLSMKPREDLFDLIHSMSKAERKAFSVYSKRHDSDGRMQKYMLLYNAVLAQSAYDEAALKKTTQGIITSGSFASFKRHLLELLEHNIREFHAGKDQAERIHEILRESELLFLRGMLPRARKKIDDCKAAANKMEDLIALLSINEMERRFALEFEIKGMGNHLSHLLNEWEIIQEKLVAENAYAMLFQRISVLIRSKFDPRLPEVSAKLPEFWDSPLLADAVNPPTFKAKRFLLQSKAFLFHLALKPAEEFDAYQQLIGLWQAHPHFQAAWPRLYKLSLTNYLHSAAKLNRFEVFPLIWKEIELISPENFIEAAEDFQTVEFSRLLYWLNTQQPQRALENIPRMENGLHKYREKVNQARNLSFRVNFCITYFLNGIYDKALQEIEFVLRPPHSDHRTDIQAFARVLEPILLFEKGEFDLALMKLHPLREWLRANRRLLDWERLLIANLEQILRAPVIHLKQAFMDFHTALKAYKEEGHSAPGLDDLLLWSQAKCSGTTISHLLHTDPTQATTA